MVDIVPLIRFDGVTKRFQAVTALSDVSFAVRTGEFHALCGENGAGKSTLMKILSGVITDYDGRIEVDGETIRLAGTRDAEERGISIIHQELNLVSDLSAAANVFLGRELTRGFGWLDTAAMERRARELFQQLDCVIGVREPVRRLRIGDQQLVEIAKALSLNSRLLIMDEPTSALTETEVERLFRVIGRLRDQGVTIIYISHKMDEVFRNADRITVLRDGKVVRTLDRADTSPEEITALMVGREIAAVEVAEERSPSDERLRVTRLSLPWRNHPRQWRLKDVSFSVRAGEVVGIAGLMGAGRTELLECLSGASPEPPTGEILLSGRWVRFHHPNEALAAGVSLVTEDRKRYGIFPQMSVREHISLAALAKCASAGIVRRARESELVDAAIGRLAIKTAGREAPITSLSGGNQQKCLIARALQVRPRLLLLDDPTRGIDVGAKAEIYRLIDRLCREGLAIVITSSELPELLTVCDRILVLCEGRLTGEFARHQFSEAAIMEAATGQV
ncbi:sugar ABC transporter ATP-binding protein [Planctellipticum variicoloris]|uniref:sugar ABC transporter ATP-binding protein n=1 Tax=Planctellipticum variicoloris TaxID=3064265 RepID=UPI0030133584|nr:sugar ABC transporter ATP-binding protein [Planctomycetaceae bacterium SH412]